jgi:hypothetical protein
VNYPEMPGTVDRHFKLYRCRLWKLEQAPPDSVW